MEVRLLGPVEVATPTPVALGGPRQRAVLAMLALAAPDVVSTDRLIDGIWGESPPAKPLATLQVFIHNLRKACASVGAPDAIQRRAPGYRLGLDPSAIDVARFEAHVAVARRAATAQPETAYRELTDALDLWRGPALADLRELPFVDAECVRLDESHLTAVEDRIDLALRLGRHTELVGRLEELVRQHPTRERMWAMLMTALYRADRQSEALAAFGRARDRLAEELGIDPGEALQQLELAILRHDPAIAPPAVATPPSVHVDQAVPPRPPAILPTFTTELLGREDLVADVVAALVHGERMVVVTGLGGCGKSRVAVAAAARAVSCFGAVVYLGATELTEPEQLLREAAALLARDGAQEPAAALAALPAEPRLLLLLDNLESVTDGDSIIADLARSCPALTVLATSRRALHLPQAVDFLVAPLDVPAVDDDPATVAASPAVRLFVQRATATAPGFRLSGAEPQVAEICRLVDGSPLSLELAAARVKVLGPARVMSSLRASLDILTTTMTSVPVRQRSVLATIEWSFARLSDVAQLVCVRLALFERGFTLDALEAVCSDVPEVVDALADIIDARLVHPDHARVDVRFLVTGTVRAFARRRLEEAPELNTLRERLSSHLLDRVRAWRAELDGATGVTAIGRFDDAAADIEGAVRWAGESGSTRLAAELVEQSTPLWIATGRVAEGRALAAMVDGWRLPGRAGAASAASVAQLAYQSADFPAAADAAERALDAAGLEADREVMALARCYLAASMVVQGDPSGGRAMAEQALGEGAALGMYPLPAVALSVIAISCAIEGDFERENDLYRRRLEFVRSHADIARTADTLNTLAEIALDGDRPSEALRFAQEALAIAGPAWIPERRDATITAARGNAGMGELSAAADLLREGFLLSDRTVNALALAQCLRTAAVLADRVGDRGLVVRLVAHAQVVSPSPTGTDDPPGADFARALATATDTLGTDAAQREWTIGSAWPGAIARLQVDGLLDQVAAAIPVALGATDPGPTSA